MKTITKNLINKLALVFLMLMSLFILGCGCNTSKPTPDPLTGWRCFSLDPNSVNKAIRNDYQDYIQKLPAEDSKFVGPAQFFEDGTGQHAVKIEVFEKNKNASWEHVLIYDKENKRINVIRYGYRRYMM